MGKGMLTTSLGRLRDLGEGHGHWSSGRRAYLFTVPLPAIAVRGKEVFVLPSEVGGLDGTVDFPAANEGGAVPRHAVHASAVAAGRGHLRQWENQRLDIVGFKMLTLVGTMVESKAPFGAATPLVCFF